MEEKERESYGVDGGGEAVGKIPLGPKVTVLTSPNSPTVGSFLPLNLRSTPPAFPILTMTSFLACTKRSLPVSRSSEEIVWASAVIETQDSSRASMATVN